MNINVNGNALNGQGNLIQNQDNVSHNSNTQMGNAQTQGGVVSDLRNLMVGDAFNGKVTAMDGNNVTLTLSNGTLLNASLKGDVNILIGQNLTFVVQQNEGNTVTLKSMQLINDQTDYVVSKALEAAGLAETPSNKEMVQKLLDYNMSISSQTLNDMAKAAIRYPDANLDTLARLQKLDIPITQENIQQFEAYKSYESQLSGEIMDMADGLTQMLSSQAQRGGAEVADTTSKILNILYGNNGEDVKSIDKQDVPNEKSTLKEPIKMFLDDSSRENLVKELSDSIKGDLPENLKKSISNGDLSARELVESMNKLLETNETDPQKLKQMLQSKDFSKLMRMVMRDTMHISPKDVEQKNGIQNFYEKMLKSTDELERLVKEKGMDESNISKTLQNVKENVEFMNDLNKNMTFFQMPIKFNENNGNGELYVFTNKKSLKQNKDEVSALLHLDMENLGPVDIYVKMKNKNVSTNFCLESEEMLDFVNEHIDQLNKRLEALGYNCKFEMKVRDEGKEHPDFLEDFLDVNMPKVNPTSQLMFDQKA